MKNIVKAGILLITLAIPAFVFLFLHGFGENRFDIPVYYPEGVDTSFVDCPTGVPHLVKDLEDGTTFAGHVSVVSFNTDKSRLNDLKRLNVDYEEYEAFQAIVIHGEKKGY